MKQKDKKWINNEEEPGEGHFETTEERKIRVARELRLNKFFKKK